MVWLYAGQVAKFSQTAKDLMNRHDIFISPIVRLELQYLYEIERITAAPHTIITDLSERIGLTVCNRDFDMIASQALALSWTRDPFDRLIVAQANLEDNLLITKDQTILHHYAYAEW